MKFLVDNQLPAALARWITEGGHDAVHVMDRAQGRSSDLELWAAAISEERIVVSKDEDFFILATRPGETGQLLWLRIGNCRKAALLQAVAKNWVAIEEAFLAGQRVVEVR